MGRSERVAVVGESGCDKSVTLRLIMGLVGQTNAQVSTGPERVLIAIALVSQPDLILAAEPGRALDVSVQAKVLALLVELQRQFELTYLFITHDLSVVRNVAGWVAVMYWGRLAELGPTPELFRDPEHPYTRMLISSIPVVSEEEALKPRWPWERNLALGLGAVSQGCPFAPRCPFAEEPCWSEVPPLASVRAGYWSACHIVSGRIENKLGTIRGEA